jgi:hypothetical protein
MLFWCIIHFKCSSVMVGMFWSLYKQGTGIEESGVRGGGEFCYPNRTEWKSSWKKCSHLFINCLPPRHLSTFYLKPLYLLSKSDKYADYLWHFRIKKGYRMFFTFWMYYSFWHFYWPIINAYSFYVNKKSCDWKDVYSRIAPFMN